MQRSRFKKALRRLASLPGGADFVRYGLNKVRHAWLKAIRSTTVTWPSSVILEVTNRCNLRCTTCPRHSVLGQQMDQGDMDFNSLKKTVDRLYPRVDSMYLTGLGEPLLYDRLVDALAYIKSRNRGIITTIATNAQVKNCHEAIGSMTEHLDGIMISVDGCGEMYGKIRPGGNFDVFVANTDRIMRRLEGAGTLVSFNMVVTPENACQMAEMVELAGRLGIPELNLSPLNVVAMPEMPENHYEYYITEECLGYLAEARERSRQYPQLRLYPWDPYQAPGFRNCPFPWGAFYITWDGYLVPCCAKPFPKLVNFGNVSEKDLLACLNDPEFKKFREMWHGGCTPGFCKRCHMVALPQAVK